MKKSTNITYCIGIDVGGTTVDFVLVDQNKDVHDSHKVLVTDDLNDCISNGLKHLVSNNEIKPSACKKINIGTTVAINSLLELKSLYRVGVLRLSGHRPDLEPAYYFPEKHRSTIFSGYRTINGGKEVDNKPISHLSRIEVVSAVNELIDNGAESLAIIGTFSPLYSDEELLIKEVIHNEISNGANIPITLSHQIAGLDFIARENSTIINAALKKVVRNSFQHLELLVKSIGFQCPIFITQNNGTLLPLDEAIEFPVKTISSGPTNSLVGASKLADLENAVIIDIGGTSTDIGIVENGFPRYSSFGSEISGIPLNFLMPDIYALSMGGGSIISKISNKYMIGPESIGREIFSKSKSFFGDILTFFDICNIVSKSKPKNGKIPELETSIADDVMHQYLSHIHKIIDKITHVKLPIVFVGGGAQNIPQSLENNNTCKPNHFKVANAYGAALAEVSGTIDRVVYLNETRDDIIKSLEEEALNMALHRGASKDKVRIIEKSCLPFYYMPNNMTRIIITAAG